MISQISIFAENKKGAMSAITNILSEAGINIHSFVTNDSAEFGIIRMIVSDTEKAGHLLADAGYQLKRTSVMGVEVSDEPGSMSRLLRIIEKANVNINYLYTSFEREHGRPVIVIHTEDMLVLETLLSGRGYVCRRIP